MRETLKLLRDGAAEQAITRMRETLKLLRDGAAEQDWTVDLSLTKGVLYHWATAARDKIRGTKNNKAVYPKNKLLKSIIFLESSKLLVYSPFHSII